MESDSNNAISWAKIEDSCALEIPNQQIEENASSFQGSGFCAPKEKGEWHCGCACQTRSYTTRPIYLVGQIDRFSSCSYLLKLFFLNSQTVFYSLFPPLFSAWVKHSSAWAIKSNYLKKSEEEIGEVWFQSWLDNQRHIKELGQLYHTHGCVLQIVHLASACVTRAPHAPRAVCVMQAPLGSDWCVHHMRCASGTWRWCVWCTHLCAYHVERTPVHVV